MVDPSLIAAAQRGDPEAFSSLVSALHRLVTGLCYAEMGDWDTAEDCAQEVFVRMHRRLPSLRDPAKFNAWLRTVVRNVCISEKRRPHRRGSSLDDLPETHRAFEGEGAASTRRSALADELGGRLDRLVSQLPEGQRRVLILRHFEELSIQEIADLTGLTAASVRTMVCRARLTLRGLIERQDPGLQEETP